ncbi:hypothetical protein HK405_003318, partial [Cladochytrium tenue]
MTTTTPPAAQPEAGSAAVAVATPSSADVGGGDSRPSDEAILQHERRLREELAASQPLVSPSAPLFDALSREYAGGDPRFVRKLDALRPRARALRRVRRDGNCFYRAFAFRVCELVLHERLRKVGGAAPGAMTPGGDWLAAVEGRVQRSRDVLTAAGYDPIITEDFYDPFWEALHASDDQSLLEKFQTE